MKELRIEEKAKRYDEVVDEIKKLRDMLLKEGVINKDGIICDNFNRIFPELKESEDEKIRKAIIEFFELQDDNTTYSLVPKKDILAWLGKQGEQNPIIEMELPEECRRISSKEYNEIVDDCICSESEPINNVAPKFHIGDTVKDPYGSLYYITEMTTDCYKTDGGRFILFKNQDAYTLFSVTPWRGEDETIMYDIIQENKLNEKQTDWLKEIKHRIITQPWRWTPTEEQMNALDYYANSLCTYCDSQDDLRSLYYDLKKL